MLDTLKSAVSAKRDNFVAANLHFGFRELLRSILDVAKDHASNLGDGSALKLVAHWAYNTWLAPSVPDFIDTVCLQLLDAAIDAIIAKLGS